MAPCLRARGQCRILLCRPIKVALFVIITLPVLFSYDPVVRSTDYVRANIPFGGWVFKPSADGLSCKATYLMEIDVCGSLPGYIVKKVTAVQGMLVKTVRDFMFRKYGRGKPQYLPLVNNPTAALAAHAAASAGPVAASGRGSSSAARKTESSKKAAKSTVGASPMAERPAAGVWATKNPLEAPIHLGPKPTVTAKHLSILLLIPLLYFALPFIPQVSEFGPLATAAIIIGATIFALRCVCAGVPVCRCVLVSAFVVVMQCNSACTRG